MGRPMRSSATKNSEQAGDRRGRWPGARRWLTLAVAVVSTLVLFWINVPGEDVTEYWQTGSSGKYAFTATLGVDWEHGWPTVYLRRGSLFFGRWALIRDVTEFRPWALLLDLGVALLIAGGGTSIMALWLRHMKTLWQFRLSTVLASFVVVALVLGWWRSMTVGMLAEQPLVKEIWALGGEVRCTFVGPVWLRKLVGRDRLRSMHRVSGVSLRAKELIWSSSDTVSEPIQADLRKLSSFTYCENLTLALPQVTNDDLSTIAAMPRLRTLSLSGTQIHDAGLCELRPLVHLTYLGVANSAITDRGLLNLLDMKDLESVDLQETRISDEGLKTLGKLSNLKELNLMKTAVTDAGLRELVGLRQLHHISARGTRVTRQGVRQFQAIRPDVEIYCQQPNAGEGG